MIGSLRRLQAASALKPDASGVSLPPGGPAREARLRPRAFPWNSLLDRGFSLQIRSGLQTRNRVFPKGSSSDFFFFFWSGPGVPAAPVPVPRRLTKWCRYAGMLPTRGEDSYLELFVYGELVGCLPVKKTEVSS